MLVVLSLESPGLDPLQRAVVPHQEHLGVAPGLDLLAAVVPPGHVCLQQLGGGGAVSAVRAEVRPGVPQLEVSLPDVLLQGAPGGGAEVAVRLAAGERLEPQVSRVDVVLQLPLLRGRVVAPVALKVPPLLVHGLDVDPDGGGRVGRVVAVLALVLLLLPVDGVQVLLHPGLVGGAVVALRALVLLDAQVEGLDVGGQVVLVAVVLAALGARHTGFLLVGLVAVFLNY